MGLPRWFSVVLVLGIVMGQLIPWRCPYEVCVCDFKKLLMTCSYLQQMPPLKTGRDMNAIQILILEVGDMTSIPNNSLPANLTNVSVINNPISYISTDAFKNSANTLTSLYIKNATFTDLPAALLQLTSLTVLMVHDMQIMDWNYAVLEHISVSLRKLEIQNINLTTFPGWLSPFTSLVSLDLSRNPLTTIPDKALGHIEGTLKFLILKDTNLSLVPNTLSSLRALHSLNLDDNKLTDLKGIPCTVLLSVSNNNISDSDALISALRPCAHVLSVLTMTSNKLTVIPELYIMTQLKHVYLDKNLISDAINGSLPNSVTHLYLQGNILTSIPTIVADNLELSILDLSYNQITEIHSRDVSHKLIEINLNSNSITYLAEDSFFYSNRIAKLHLKSNPLSDINLYSLVNLHNIKNLNLGDTKLTKVPLALTYLKRLKILSMGNISTLSCPCPPVTDLVKWYRKERWNLLSSDTCNDGKNLRDYLLDKLCQLEIRPIEKNGEVSLSTTGMNGNSTASAHVTNRCNVFVALYALMVYELCL